MNLAALSFPTIVRQATNKFVARAKAHTCIRLHRHKHRFLDPDPRETWMSESRDKSSRVQVSRKLVDKSSYRKSIKATTFCFAALEATKNSLPFVQLFLFFRQRRIPSGLSQLRQICRTSRQACFARRL